MRLLAIFSLIIICISVLMINGQPAGPLRYFVDSSVADCAKKCKQYCPEKCSPELCAEADPDVYKSPYACLGCSCPYDEFAEDR